MEKPFASYAGSDPYVFVCYAHVDQAVVYPEIARLHEAGVNIWYDEGISGGRVWRAEVGSAIERASRILFYISRASLKSDHCSREMNFALDVHKEIVPVYLEDVELTTDLRVGLSSIQALQRNNDPRYDEHLIAALKAQPASQDRVLPVPESKSKVSSALLGALCLALAAIAMLLWSFRAAEEPPTGSAGIPLIHIADFEYLASPAQGGLEYELQRRLAASSELVVRTGAATEAAGDYVIRGVVERDAISLQLADRQGNNVQSWQFPAASDLSIAASAVSREVLRSLGLNEAVLNRFEQAVDPEAFKSYLQAIMLMRQSHSPETMQEVRDILQLVLNQAPRYAPAHAALCGTYLDTYLQSRVESDFQLAESHCFRALTLDDLDHSVHLALGTLYRESGQLEKAIGSLNRSLELSPYSTRAMREMGSTLARKGNAAEATGWYRKAIEVEPSHWENYQSLAFIQFMSGDLGDALESFEIAMTLAPDELSILNNIGAVHFRMADYEAAINYWQRLAGQQPRAQVFANLGTAYYFRRHYEQSAAQYQKASELNPNDYRYLGEIANVMYVSGDESYKDYFQRAIELAQKQLVIDPSDQLTNASVAGFYAAMDDAENAQRYRDRIAGNRNDNLEVLYQLAVSYSRQGDAAQSADLLQQLIAAGYERKLIEMDANFDQAMQYLVE